MHSHITSDHEGKCPICGMDLVPQTIAQAIAGESDTPHQHGMDEHTAASEHQPAGAAIQIDPGVRNNLSMRVSRVVRGYFRREIRTIGKISRIDPTRSEEHTSELQSLMSI